MVFKWAQAIGGPPPPKPSDKVIDEYSSMVTAACCALVLICTLLGNLASRFNTDYWFHNDSALAILIGFVASLPFCGESYTKIHDEFDTIFFLYLVPPILFEAGFALNRKDFFKNISAIITLAVVGTIVASMVLGISLFLLAKYDIIDGVSGENPKEALMFGSMMSATDPIATLAVLGSLDVEPQLYSLVFGESVINDAIAVVLFQTFANLPDGEDFALTPEEGFKAVKNFLIVGFGSVFLGMIFGIASALLSKHVVSHRHAHAEVTIVLTIAYLSFIVADVLDVSGLMSIFFCGVLMSHYTKHNLSHDGRETMHNVARTLAYISETFVFVYFGFTILPTVYSDCHPKATKEDVSASAPDDTKFDLNWPFIGWSLLLCLISRAVNIFPLSMMLNLCKTKSHQQESKISYKSMTMIWFSGLRGAIAFALALTVKGPNRHFIIPCVVIIILFTNVFLGQLTAPMLRLLKVPLFVNREREVAKGAVFNRLDSIGGSFSLTHANIGSESIFSLDHRGHRSKWHRMWRRVEERFVKPYLGGRVRDDIGSHTGGGPPRPPGSLAPPDPNNPHDVLRHALLTVREEEERERRMSTESGEILADINGEGGGAAGAAGGGGGGGGGGGYEPPAVAPEDLDAGAGAPFPRGAAKGEGRAKKGGKDDADGL